MFKNRATDRRTDGTTNRPNGFEKRPFLDSVGPNIRESWSFRHMFVYAETEWKWLRKSRYELGTLLWLLYSKKGNLSLQFYLCPFFQTLFEQTCSLKIWWLCLCTGPTDSTTTIAPPSLSPHILCHWKYSNKTVSTTTSVTCGWAGKVMQMWWPFSVNLHGMTDRRTDVGMGRWADGWTDEHMTLTHCVNTWRGHRAERVFAGDL